MSIFRIQAPDGRIVTLEGEEAPSDLDLDEIFASLPTVEPPAPTVQPEPIVAPTPVEPAIPEAPAVPKSLVQRPAPTAIGKDLEEPTKEDSFFRDVYEAGKGGVKGLGASIVSALGAQMKMKGPAGLKKSQESIERLATIPPEELTPKQRFELKQSVKAESRILQQQKKTIPKYEKVAAELRKVPEGMEEKLAEAGNYISGGKEAGFGNAIKNLTKDPAKYGKDMAVLAANMGPYTLQALLPGGAGLLIVEESGRWSEDVDKELKKAGLPQDLALETKEKTSDTFGLMSGTTEFFQGRAMLAPIKFLRKAPGVKNLIAKGLKTFKGKVAVGLAGGIFAALSEGAEEWTQAKEEALTKAIYYGAAAKETDDDATAIELGQLAEKHIDQFWSGQKREFIIGTIMGGVMGAPGTAAGIVKTDAKTAQEEALAIPPQQTKEEASKEAFLKVLEATTPDKAQIQQQEEVVEEKKPPKEPEKTLEDVRKEGIREGKAALKDSNQKIKVITEQIKRTPKGKEQRALVAERKKLREDKRKMVTEAPAALIDHIDEQIDQIDSRAEAEALMEAITYEKDRTDVEKSLGEEATLKEKLAEINELRRGFFLEEDEAIPEAPIEATEQPVVPEAAPEVAVEEKVAQEEVSPYIREEEAPTEAETAEEAEIEAQQVSEMEEAEVSEYLKNPLKQAEREIKESTTDKEKKQAEKLRKQAEDAVVPGALSATESKEYKSELKKANTPHSVVRMDGRNVKGLNDELGHEGANKVWKDVYGDILQKGIEEKGGVLLRTGGDEFVAVFPNQQKENVNEIMEDLSNKVDAKIEELGYGKLEHPRYGLKDYGTLSIDYHVEDTRTGTHDEIDQRADKLSEVKKVKFRDDLAALQGKVWNEGAQRYVKKTAGQPRPKQAGGPKKDLQDVPEGQGPKGKVGDAKAVKPAKAEEVTPTPSKAERVVLTAKEKAAQQKDKAVFEAKKKKDAQRGFVDLSRTPEKVPERTSGATNFEVPNETRRDFLRRKLQDSFIRLRRVQEAPGIKVDKKTDAYLKQELLHGRTEKRLKDIERDYVVPLRKDIVRSKVDFNEFEDFLYAKHAPERNKYIQSINKEFRTKEEIVDEAGNVIDVRELGEGGSGMTNKEAADILENAKQKGLTEKYERLAKQVKAINKKRVHILREEGLEDPAVLDKWEKYQNYVPLRGINEPETQKAHTGKGLSVTGPESKRALGRRSKASNILSNSLLGLQETIVRAEKNRVGKSFLQLARDNPNSNLWEINPVEKKKMFDKRTGEVVSRVDPFTKFDDDVLIVKEGGKEFAIKIKDEALARAMTNMGADKSGKVVQLLGTFNRYLSAINTTFVPEFVISNFARDIQTATINMSGENSFKTARQVAKDVPKAMKGAWQGIRDKGDSEWKKWYNEFEEAGGKIGFFGLENIEDLQKNMMQEMSLMRPGVKSTSLKMFRAAKDFVMDVNGSVENATRLSVYVNMRKQNRSKEEAASVAKNITVNFNRKGELGTLMNSLYMFSNASIQGNVRMLRAARSPKVRKILGGIAVGSLALAQMNRMIAGEDDDGENFYDKVPKWVKENNLVIMKPNGKFFKIPLPYGYNIFYSVGQAVDNAVHNPGSVMESASMVAGTVANSFNPLGATSTLLQTLVPSQFRWLADLGLNKNFFGSPIAKEQKFGPKKAKAETYFKSSTQGSRMVAQSLNELTGGSKYKSGLLDVSPDAIDYVLEYLSGGAGRSVIQALEFADKVATNKPIPTRRIPFVRRVAGEVHEFQNTQKFYERYDEIQKVKAEYKDLKALDGAEAVKFKIRHLETLGLEKMAKKIVSRISSLNKYKAKAKTDKKVKFYEKAIKVQVDRFNKIYNKRIK